MPAVELAQVRGHQSGIGQACGRIVLGEPGDRAGLGHGRLQALLAQVRGAGAALALAVVHGDIDAAVAGRLDHSDAAHAHADVDAAPLRARHLGLGRASGAAALEQARGDGFEVVQARLAVVGGVNAGGEARGQWTILATWPGETAGWRKACAAETKKPVSSSAPAAASSGATRWTCWNSRSAWL